MRWVKKPIAAQMKRAQTNMTYVVDGNKCANEVPQGQYFQLINSTIAGRSDGVYTASKAIPANYAIDNTYFSQTSPIAEGAINKINGELATLNNNKASVKALNLANKITASTTDALKTALLSYISSNVDNASTASVVLDLTTGVTPPLHNGGWGAIIQKATNNYFSLICSNNYYPPVLIQYNSGTWYIDSLALDSKFTWRQIYSNSTYKNNVGETLSLNESIANAKLLRIIAYTNSIASANRILFTIPVDGSISASYYSLAYGSTMYTIRVEASDTHFTVLSSSLSDGIFINLIHAIG